MTRIGRNDPCPCKSGKKYKKCCLLKESAPPSSEVVAEAIKVLKAREAEEQALRERGIFINYVRPATYTNPKTGQRVRAWALRNRLYHTRPEHETFHEFIVSHLQREVLGKEWWDEQVQAAEKHFVFTCFTKWDEWKAKNSTEANKADEHTWAVVPDGYAKTLSSLAFDVATLEHTQQLPEHLVKRLRNRKEYQGAHYEIAVAAMFARLGCRIDFLDKEKLTAPHCEFVATHQDTGVSIAVEAKSRQRPGVKHMPGAAKQEQLLKGDVKRLFDRALKQNPKDRPFVVFIDINAPLTPEVPVPDKPWVRDLRTMMDSYQEPMADEPAEYTAVIFTNFSPHYDGENPSAPNEYLGVIPRHATHPLPNTTFGDMLLKAVRSYGFVPHLVETS